MIISIMAPSSPRPIGGVIALYQFANGLRRRGHQVQLIHGPYFGQSIESLDDVAWFDFEDGIDHLIIGGDPWELVPPEQYDHLLPPADLLAGVGVRPEVGLPVKIIQGIDMIDGRFERYSYLAPGLTICIAKWLIDQGQRFGVSAERLVHVPLGMDHERFRVITPMQDRPPQVAMLYSAHPVKAWDVGRAVLQQVHERVPEARVSLFGTDAPPDQLPDWMTFHLDPDADVLVREIYNTSQVFLQPSHHEGFGFTAVEAMACGCALVSTDNGGSLDYAFHDDTALLAPPRDVDLLATHIVRLLGDDALRRRIATSGVRHVRSFDWDVSAALMEAAFERYLADPDRYLVDPAGDISDRPLPRTPVPPPTPDPADREPSEQPTR